MQKTKLGITIAMFAAAIYVVALGGGYVPAILLGGYVLLREENEWLKWNAVRAVAAILRRTVWTRHLWDHLDLEYRLAVEICVSCAR